MRHESWMERDERTGEPPAHSPRVEPTPGPWFIGNPNVANPSKYQVFAMEPRCDTFTGRLQIIAHCNANGEMVPGIDEANARLISAAPEMFDALKAMAALDECEAHFEDAYERALPLVRAALRKATGEP